MVIKGSARANPGELAYHLLREDTNESVRMMGFSDVASDDLREALFEMHAMGAGSRSRRTLYHASINTPVSEQLTPEQQRIARERLAIQCGLQSQPFAVVEHIKNGRQHIHVVWSRIDVETGRAISDSHNYRKHELVCRSLEREFGHERVLGAHIRDKDTEPRPERGPSWAEQRQAERSGIPVAEAKRIVTQCWAETATGAEFRYRLEQAGFTVARGDRRDFVLVDGAGEVHGLSRRLEGVKAAAIRERMNGLEALPDLETARKTLRDSPVLPAFTGTAERLRAAEKRDTPDSPGPVLPGFNGEIADAVRRLNQTMRGQVEQTIVSRPDAAARQAVREEIHVRTEPAAAYPRFDPRFAREDIRQERQHRPEPEAHRPPAFDPVHAREETVSVIPERVCEQDKKRSLAGELREQLRRGTEGPRFGRSL